MIAPCVDCAVVHWIARDICGHIARCTTHSVSETNGELIRPRYCRALIRTVGCNKGRLNTRVKCCSLRSKISSDWCTSDPVDRPIVLAAPSRHNRSKDCWWYMPRPCECKCHYQAQSVIHLTRVTHPVHVVIDNSLHGVIRRLERSNHVLNATRHIWKLF